MRLRLINVEHIKSLAEIWKDSRDNKQNYGSVYFEQPE